MNFEPAGRRRFSIYIKVVGLVVVLWLGFQANRVRAASYTVSNTNDAGAGSFRQALEDANANPGLDSIVFSISGTGPFTISPASNYPPIIDPVIIDATTQPGYAGQPRIQIDGSNFGPTGDGVLILASGTTVKGLAIGHCQRDGIRIQGPATNNIIQGNYLGTDVTGAIARGNAAGGGLTIFRSSGNLIGGTNAAARNVISGGNMSGIFVIDPPASNNVIQGNYIGTTASGTGALSNLQNGIVISAAAQNLVGGTTPGARNIISGNGQSGIYLINAGATGNMIQGNYIGANVNGNSALSNGADGITIAGVPGNTIGGTGVGAGNVISGNNGRGVFIYTAGATGNLVQGNLIGTDATGKSALPNYAEGVTVSGVPGNTIGGGAAARNVISGNLQSGVLLAQTGASGNVVAGNFVGLDITGTNALPNGFSGVTLDGVTGNLVGGTAVDAGNVISGNGQNGVYLVDTGCVSNTVQGNFIGTDSMGTRAISNATAGVRMDVPGNLIGGVTAGARNLISGNAQAGVYIVGAAAGNNVVQGNFIGTDASGTRAVGNGNSTGSFPGVHIAGAAGNTIGGTSMAARNLISANLYAGVWLDGAGTTGNLVQGNYIGSDVNGSNALGNADVGVYVSSAPANTIGGAVAGAGNLISGNALSGIIVAGANNTVIQGNFIGTKADGVHVLANGQHNIDFESPIVGGLVGGSVPAADNRIAFAGQLGSGFDGIRIRPGVTGVFVSRNSIFSNGANSATGLGIDLGTDGVTLNDLGDADGGANLQQNFPVLTNASQTGVKGTLNSTTNGTFLLQFYASPTANVSGYGEGMNYLCSTNVTTDASGNAGFAEAFPTAIPSGWVVSATATDVSGNTSEFSLSITASQSPPLGITRSGVPAGQFALLWPTNPPGFGVVQTTNLASPVVWTPVTNAPVVSGGTNRVTLSVTNGFSRFFRLQLQ